MSPDDFDIIGYLEDTLDDSERAAFEDELAKNKELGEALAWFRGLTGALSGEGPDDVAESIDVETLAAIAQGGTKPTPAQWRHLLLNEETRRELAMLRVPSDEVESLPFETAPLPESIRVEVEAMARGRVRGKIEDLLGVLAEGGQLLGEKTKEVVGALTGALSGLDPVPAYYLEEGPGQVGAPSPEGDRPRVESLRVEAPGAVVEVVVRGGTLAVQCDAAPQGGLIASIETAVGDRLTGTAKPGAPAVFRDVAPGPVKVTVRAAK